MDARWIGLILSVVVFVSGLARIFWVGQARIKSLEEASAKNFRQSRDHYSHESDDDAHWTKREREALTQTLADISGDVKTILRNGSK